jgi:phosphatidylserine/phosphatidylglycerophosphate/cardiolipin synthase-like enzyme
LVPRVNCSAIAETPRSGLLVDARDYFRAVYWAACEAQSYILISGWQFDSSVELLRGEDAVGAPYPVTLRGLLSALANERPGLEVYLLAWDYSLVYALEREWMQKLIFDWTTPSAIRFRFDDRHPTGASHHQKMVVVDGRIGVAGGIDLACNRWDDRRHEPTNSHRKDGLVVHGPYHDTAGFLTGPAVGHLEGVFAQRWERATGSRLDLPSTEPGDAPHIEGTLPLRAHQVALSRTEGAFDGRLAVEEIKNLYQRAIATAERTIYMETQYFTSHIVHDALVSRMRDRRRARPEIVVIMPRGADTPKERLALADAQNHILASLYQVAEQTESKFRVYYSAAVDGDGNEVPTFIHSKLLIVDDRLLSVGSANLTNRSMSLDTELNLSWEAHAYDTELASDIARVRASLIAEHAGIEQAEFVPRQGFRSVTSTENLVARLDEIAKDALTRLQPRVVSSSIPESERVIRLERIFDPDTSLSELELLDAFQLPGAPSTAKTP